MQSGNTGWGGNSNVCSDEGKGPRAFKGKEENSEGALREFEKIMMV